MSQAHTLPAPEIPAPDPVDPAWERERQAFLTMKESLLAEYRGRFVAVREGRVVESGHDQVAVALRAYERFGYVPIYVGLVSTEPQPSRRIPTPRRFPRESGE